MEEEVWKPIKGWNGKYWISSHGRFKSFGIKYSKKCPDGYITQGSLGFGGYYMASLRTPKAKQFHIRIHTLVGEHFCEKPLSTERLCINHIDGNKLNNYYKNLEWCTWGDNIKHAVRIGLHNLKGEKHPNVKLTEKKVIEMRALRKTGLTHQQIADKFGIDRRQAGDVINGVNWGWLKEGL